jgi:hypothetical protein
MTGTDFRVIELAGHDRRRHYSCTRSSFLGRCPKIAEFEISCQIDLLRAGKRKIERVCWLACRRHAERFRFLYAAERMADLEEPTT